MRATYEKRHLELGNMCFYQWRYIKKPIYKYMVLNKFLLTSYYKRRGILVRKVLDWYAVVVVSSPAVG